MFKKCKKLAWGFLVSVFVFGGSLALGHSSALPEGYTEEHNIGTIQDCSGGNVTVYAKNDKNKNEVSFYFYDKNSTSKCILYLDQLSKILSSRYDLKGTQSVVFENVEQIYTDEYSHKSEDLVLGKRIEPAVSMISLFPKMQFFACESLVFIGNRAFWNIDTENNNFISITTPKLGKIGSYAFAHNKKLGLENEINFDEVVLVGLGAFYEALEDANVGLWNMDMSDSQLRGKVFQGSLAKTVNCVLLKED